MLTFMVCNKLKLESYGRSSVLNWYYLLGILVPPTNSSERTTHIILLSPVNIDMFWWYNMIWRHHYITFCNYSRQLQSVLHGFTVKHVDIPEARSGSSSSTVSLVAGAVGGFVALFAGLAAAFGVYWHRVLRSSNNDQGSAAQPGPSETASNTAPPGETSKQSDKCSISWVYWKLRGTMIPMSTSNTVYIMRVVYTSAGNSYSHLHV